MSGESPREQSVTRSLKNPVLRLVEQSFSNWGGSRCDRGNLIKLPRADLVSQQSQLSRINNVNTMLVGS